MYIKPLAVLVCLLGVIAVVLSLSGYPKLITVSSNLSGVTENTALALKLTNYRLNTSTHLITNSSSYNLQVVVELTPRSDLRLENTNFWINCYDDSLRLINCTDGKISDQDFDKKYYFGRAWSRLTKTPLDLTLTKESEALTYKPEFFGIDLSVQKLALVFATTPYSRTNLTSITTQDLVIPFEVKKF